MLKIVTEKQKHIIKYEGAKFTVVPNTKDEAQNILKKNTYMHEVKTGDDKDPKFEERIDWVAVHADSIDTQVVAWSGIEGNPECNSENKRALALCRENDHICTFLKTELDQIGKAHEKKKEKKKGN